MAVAIITFFLGCILGITVASLCSAAKTGDDLISSCIKEGEKQWKLRIRLILPLKKHRYTLILEKLQLENYYPQRHVLSY